MPEPNRKKYNPDGRTPKRNPNANGFGPKPPYKPKRNDGPPPSNDRPYNNDRGPRPFDRSNNDDRPYGKKPYGRENGNGPQRPAGNDRGSKFDRFGPPNDRPYGNRPNNDRPYGNRPGGDRPNNDRPYGNRSGNDRPNGDRPNFDRPFNKDRGRGTDRPYGNDRGPRPFRDDRPARDDRPFREDRPSRDERPFRAEKPAPKPRPAPKARPDGSERPKKHNHPEKPRKAEPVDVVEAVEAVTPTPVIETAPAEAEVVPTATVETPTVEAPVTEAPVEEVPIEEVPVDEPERTDEETTVEEPSMEEPSVEEDVAPAEEPEAEAEPETEAQPEEEVPASGFATLGIAANIFRAIGELGFETPTPIQAGAIPVLLAGKDLLGLAQTGTGKTAAFAIPLLQRVNPSKRGVVQALVVAPTRELAVQVADGIHKIGRHTGLRIVPVYGGQPIDRQIRALQHGCEILVGTPGRLLDHIRRGSLTLEHVTYCVLDEADEMLNLGFAEDIEAILADLPEERQLAFFSATMPPRIEEIARRFLQAPERVSIEAKRRTVDTTKQSYYEVPKGGKLDALVRILDMETPGPTIVFCRTRQETQDLTEALQVRGYSAEPLHGDMGQSERERVMKRFREGGADLLVATDVAARGIDIDTVTHVINYDIPWDVEQYIHRVGRTGRAGRTGDAITLVEGRQRRQLRFIEDAIGVQMTPARVPTAADVAVRRREIFREGLRETLDAGEFDGMLELVQNLGADYDVAEVAAAALHLLWKERNTAPMASEDEIAIDGGQPEAGMTRLFVSMGRQDGLRPGDLVGAITHEVGLHGKQVGAIDILDRNAFVEVPVAEADRVIEVLSSTKIRNRFVKVQRARPEEAEAALARKNDRYGNDRFGGDRRGGSYGRRR